MNKKRPETLTPDPKDVTVFMDREAISEILGTSDAGYGDGDYYQLNNEKGGKASNWESRLAALKRGDDALRAALNAKNAEGSREVSDGGNDADKDGDPSASGLHLLSRTKNPLIEVFFQQGDDAFICGVNGHITTDVLAEIEKDLFDDPPAFERGDGSYLYEASYVEAQRGNEGRIELSSYWQLDLISFTAMPKEGSKHVSDVVSQKSGVAVTAETELRELREENEQTIRELRQQLDASRQDYASIAAREQKLVEALKLASVNDSDSTESVAEELRAYDKLSQEFRPQGQTVFADWANRVELLQRENVQMREMLYASNTGMRGYHDDGELQDTTVRPWIDFKRDSVAAIRAAFYERNVAAMNAQKAEGSLKLSDVVTQPIAALSPQPTHEGTKTL